MKALTREEKIEALSRADKFALRIYVAYVNVDTSNYDKELYQIGKEISESLEPDMWEPSDKRYYYDSGTVFPIGDSGLKTHDSYIIRGADTIEEAERCLRNEQIQNRINSWIREENKKTGYKADYRCFNQNKYFPEFNYDLNEWQLLVRLSLQPINQEMCNKESGNKLIEMLNAGMIKNVPTKMEVDKWL